MSRVACHVQGSQIPTSGGKSRPKMGRLDVRTQRMPQDATSKLPSEVDGGDGRSRWTGGRGSWADGADGADHAADGETAWFNSFLLEK